MVHYFLGNRLLASGPHYWWDEARYERTSYAFFCPHCGETWARVANDASAHFWQAINAPCPKHGTDYREGGTFILPWHRGCPEWLPPEVIQYELQTRLNQT